MGLDHYNSFLHKWLRGSFFELNDQNYHTEKFFGFKSDN